MRSLCRFHVRCIAKKEINVQVTSMIAEMHLQMDDFLGVLYVLICSEHAHTHALSHRNVFISYSDYVKT